MPISQDTLRKYKERANIFIETGTHLGHTVQIALNVGFSKIYTIELAQHHYENAVKRFQNEPRVNLIFGASEYKLSEILAEVNEPAVFWLDGHYSEGDTALGEVPVPLYFELEEIAKHHINNHTILVDDIRLMGTEWDIDQNKIKELLLKINPKYKLSYEHGYLDPVRKINQFTNDILVASL